jgi:hypothetical protein
MAATEDAMAEKKLMLFHPKVRASAQGITGPYWKIGPQDQQEISTLSDMVKEINKRTSLDELVIDCHGYTGGMMLEGDDDDEKGYDLGEDAVKRAFTKTKTQIEHIRFEGCWVGESPLAMAAFGRLFNAQDVSGFTWTRNTNTIKVKIINGMTPDELSAFLGKQGFAKWLAPTTQPMSYYASMARSKEVSTELWLEWFQPDLNSKPPYEDQDGNSAAASGSRSNFQKAGSHTYKVRSEAGKRTVLAKDAKPSDGQPHSEFNYVTVKLR